eukprot:23147-Pelagococcus_subviridis.AAC.5
MFARMERPGVRRTRDGGGVAAWGSHVADHRARGDDERVAARAEGSPVAVAARGGARVADVGAAVLEGAAGAREASSRDAHSGGGA